MASLAVDDVEGALGNNTGDAIPVTEANLPAIAQNLGADAASKQTELPQVPSYTRSLDSFDHVICHVGVGGFHRR